MCSNNPSAPREHSVCLCVSLLKPDLFYFFDLCRLQITALEGNTNLTLISEGYDPLWFTQGHLYKCTIVVIYGKILNRMVTLPPQKDEPDAFKELGTGNRVATWLFYVSKLFLNNNVVNF